MVSHKTGTLGLSGRPGSIPGVGVNLYIILNYFNNEGGETQGILGEIY